MCLACSRTAPVLCMMACICRLRAEDSTVFIVTMNAGDHHFWLDQKQKWCMKLAFLDDEISASISRASRPKVVPVIMQAGPMVRHYLSKASACQCRARPTTRMSCSMQAAEKHSCCWSFCQQSRTIALDKPTWPQVPS